MPHARPHSRIFTVMLTVLGILLAHIPLSAQDRSIYSALDTQGRAIASSMTLQGQLTGSDLLSSEGLRVQVWSLSTTSGTGLRVDLRSSDFDAFLYATGPGLPMRLSDDDSGGNLDAQICFRPDMVGDYRIVAASLDGSLGAFTLSVEELSDSELDECTTPLFEDMSFDGIELNQSALTSLAELPTEGRTVSLGEELDGRLNLDGPQHPRDGRTIQPWSLELYGGSTVFVDVVSDDFDPLAYAVGPSIEGELFNDDGIGADGCNTRLEIGPDVSGPVTLLIGSYQEEMGGRFLLRVSEDPPPLESGGCGDFAQETFGGPSDETTDLNGLPASSAGRIRIGTERFGVLEASSEILLSGVPAETWSVAVDQGDRLVIELISDDFDAVLHMDGPGILTPLMDDDGMGMTHARIETTAVLSGQLRIVVTGFDASAAGRYRLRVIRQGR
ncbi:MAG: hypothetical protein ACPGPI_07970 [Longimicrobiales bacterium]